ncbi:MAG TPA: pectin acetylesterase-family hydrolase [Ilumatobacteraceae bacterium]
MTSRPVAIALTCLAVLAVSCSDDGDSAESPSDAPTTPADTTATDETAPPGATAPTDTEPTVAPTEPTTAPTEPTAPPTFEVQAWQRIAPGGDCSCADGSEFAFWERRADPTKVMFYLQGGGACFNEATCKFQGGTYTVQANEDPSVFNGIFDAANPENPAADYSIVYVPYCTGDIHLGDKVTEYSPTLTVRHKGYVNASTAMQYLVDQYPDADEILVTGISAGSIPTPLFAGLLSDTYTDATIRVLADGSGAYQPTSSGLTGPNGPWGTDAAIPEWPETEGLAPEDFSIPGMFVLAGQHAPQITFTRHDYAYDEVQGFFMGAVGQGGIDLLESQETNEALIESEGGIDLASYVAPGSQHTVLLDPRFYDETVNGVRLVDWVADVLSGASVPDVKCEECSPP